MTDTTPDTSEHPSPAAVMLRAAVLPAALVGLVAVGVSALESPAGAVGAAAGAVIAAVACAVPAGVLLLSGKWSAPAVMGVAMGAYLVLVVILGVVYVALADASWLSRPHLGWTLMAAAAVAIAWQVRQAGRLRVLAFGSPTDLPPPDAPPAA